MSFTIYSRSTTFKSIANFVEAVSMQLLETAMYSKQLENHLVTSAYINSTKWYQLLRLASNACLFDIQIDDHEQILC